MVKEVADGQPVPGGNQTLIGFNFAPRGYAQCDGQLLPINQNQSLFSLLGTTYGGDGRTTFALPGLRGRVALHETSGFALGQKSGQESHTLIPTEAPNHDHTAQASQDDATTGNAGPTAGTSVLAKANFDLYRQFDATTETNLNTGVISNVGGQAHENMQPFQTINFCIAIQGLFPSRN